jgi:hypothetical protein
LPDSSTALTPFELAAAAVEEWLDGAGAAFMTRTKQSDPRRKAASWDLELQHAVLGPQRVRFSIPRDFPATPPQVHVDKKLCLVLPHVEKDGKFCHDVESSPKDYEWPAGAAEAVLQSLEKFWVNTLDVEWVQEEFHRERLSYWLHFCEQFRTANNVPTPHVVRAALQPLDGVTEGKVTAYFRQSQKLRSEVMLATVEDADPHVIARRHGWPVGALVRGYALFVPVPENIRWTPRDWPRTLQELESFVAQVTDHERSVIHWIEGKKDESSRPFLVVLVQENVCYGYLVAPAPVPRATPPGIIPVAIDRVDADWALARDHQLPALRTRREKRVLLLGCGSLGAPVAELLARAGVGELHVLDKEVFEPENCARHVLGAGDIGLSKADALATRLRQLVPGLNIKSYRALAADWVRHVCKPGNYDLVVNCTGESSIRVMLTHYRNHSLGPCPLVHAWVEPFCAAAHVVHLAPNDAWPADDPGEKVAAASWPEGTRVDLPACGAGFHPYGAADVWQAAGFSAERLLAILDGKVTASTVWSWMRSKAFFDSLGVDVVTGLLVPDTKSAFDSAQLTRSLKDVLGDG